MAKCYRGSPVYRQFVGARNDQLAMRAAASARTAARNVFYTGPCPAADPNDQTNMDSALCNGICGNICSGLCGLCGDGCHGAPEPAVCLLAVNHGLLFLGAGSPLPLTDLISSVGPVGHGDDSVAIGQTGRYLAAAVLEGTARANISGAIVLLKNGTPVDGGALSVIAMQGERLALVGQSVFSAQEGDVLQLVTTGAIAVTGRNIVSLVLLRIG